MRCAAGWSEPILCVTQVFFEDVLHTVSNHNHVNFIKGSWEAIFRVTDEINPMQGGVCLHIPQQ